MIAKFLNSVENFLNNGAPDRVAEELRQLSRLSSAHSTGSPTPLTDSPFRSDDQMHEVVAGKAEAERHLDTLPYGAFQVDKGGAVLAFNDCEAEIHGGLPMQCIGQNFFTEIAPCTRRPEFLGRFMEGVEKGNLNALFQFIFTFREESTRVWVCLKQDPQNSKAYWIFIKRI
jgi:photoactive yellow protein